MTSIEDDLRGILNMALGVGPLRIRFQQARQALAILDLAQASNEVRTLLCDVDDLDAVGFFDAVGAALEEIRREDARMTYRDLVGEYVSLD